MARARNIKPGVMDNEQLAAQPFSNRLLFVFLWMLADRDGRLEDRPARIAAQAFPYDRSFDVARALDELAAAGFIRRYVAAGHAVIQIQNFAKHQSPHGTERDGALPDEHGMLTVHKRTPNGYATGERSMTPCVPINTAEPKPTDAARQQLGNSALTVNQQNANTLIHRFTDSLIHSVSNETGASAATADADTEDAQHSAGDTSETAKEKAWRLGLAVFGDGSSARGKVGKLCKQAADDHELLCVVFADCLAEKPIDPMPWCTRSITSHQQNPKSGRGAAFDPLSNPTPTWATGAGFESRFLAENEGCFAHNAHQFKNGQRTEVTT